MSRVTAVVDFGTSHTVTVVSGPGGGARLVTVDSEPWAPSAVFLDRGGALVVGRDALRLAGAEPARLEPRPKARMGEQEVLLGDTVVPVVELVRAVLAAAVAAAGRQAGGPVQHLALTHPADWGPNRLGVLLAAAQGLAPRVSTVPEPVGAAAWFAEQHGLAPGARIAVLDFGGGTCDAAVVQREPGGLAVVGCAGLPDLGGADIDERIVEHLRRTVPGLAARLPADAAPGRVSPGTLRELMVFRQDVRHAKELLSRHPQADVVLPSGLPDALLTRAEFEALVAPDLRRAADLLAATTRGEPVAVQLVGGSSRIPLLSQVLTQRTGLQVRLDDQPEAVVALGAHSVVAEQAPPGPTTSGSPAAPPDDRSAGDTRRITVVSPLTPPPARSRKPWVPLALAVTLLAGVLVAGLTSGGPVPGTAVQAQEQVTLPPPAQGNEIVVPGSATDELTQGELLKPVVVQHKALDMEWTVRSVRDPATDVLAGLGNDTPDTVRWILVDTVSKARQPARAPYFSGFVALIDDRGMRVDPDRSAKLPAECPAVRPPVLQAGEEHRECFAFRVRKGLPVTAVTLAIPVDEYEEPGRRQRGAFVRFHGAPVAGEPLPPVDNTLPLGTVREIVVKGVRVRVAPVDLVRAPSAYLDDFNPLSQPGTRAVVLRVVVEPSAPVELETLAEGLLLVDDRRSTTGWKYDSQKNGCTPRRNRSTDKPNTIDERVVFCGIYSLPTGTPVVSVAAYDPDRERVWFWKV